MHCSTPALYLYDLINEINREKTMKQIFKALFTI